MITEMSRTFQNGLRHNVVGCTVDDFISLIIPGKYNVSMGKNYVFSAQSITEKTARRFISLRYQITDQSKQRYQNDRQSTSFEHFYLHDDKVPGTHYIRILEFDYKYHDELTVQQTEQFKESIRMSLKMGAVFASLLGGNASVNYIDLCKIIRNTPLEAFINDDCFIRTFNFKTSLEGSRELLLGEQLARDIGHHSRTGKTLS